MLKLGTMKALPLTRCEQILTTFPELCSEMVGSKENGFLRFSALENIQPDSLVYVLQDKFVEKVLNSTAKIVLAPAKFKALIPENSQQTWILSPNPELLMAMVKSRFVQATPYRAAFTGIHSTAIIDPTATVAKSCTVGPHAVIGPRCKIGENSFVGANAMIEADVEIGESTTIHPLAYIGHSCIIGNRCEVMPQATIGSEGYGYAHDHKGNHYRIPHTGRVILQDDVHVGANSAIDRGSLEDSIIGQGTKIDNQCHLAHNSVIGRNGLITAQFGMAGSSKIGNNFITGGKTSVTGHIEITDNVHVGGMSGVTKDIEKPGAYAGFPLQPLQEYLKTKAAIAKLHELRQQVRSLLKPKE